MNQLFKELLKNAESKGYPIFFLPIPNPNKELEDRRNILELALIIHWLYTEHNMLVYVTPVNNVGILSFMGMIYQPNKRFAFRNKGNYFPDPHTALTFATNQAINLVIPKKKKDGKTT